MILQKQYSMKIYQYGGRRYEAMYVFKMPIELCQCNSLS